MVMTFQGKRVYLSEEDIRDNHIPLLKPGEYLKTPGDTWICETPNGHGGNLAAHKVTEHEDGTITVKPSIKVSTSRDRGKTWIELWHGFLEKGIWREI